MKKFNIVKKNWEFQNIISCKKQFISKYLILYYVKDNEFEIGISIPKKFANAVKRNYIKRQIKSIISIEKNIIEKKYKIVLIVRKDFICLPYEEKKTQIVKIFEKLK